MSLKMSSRLQFFSTILSKLGRAAAKGFNSLSVVVEDLRLPRQFAELPDPSVQDGSACMAGVDWRGVTLYPKDAPQELTPTSVTGDGSCFYNACSVALYGTESYSKELRVRTIIELVSSIDYYSSDPLPYLTGVSGTVSDAGLLDTILSNNARKELISNGREAALKKEAINTCEESSWASILHIAAMTNVVSGPLQSIFPEYSPRIRPYYNRTFYPKDWNHQQNDKTSIYIMWCGRLNSTTSMFVPDHFVPCLKQSGGTSASSLLKWGVTLNEESELELWKTRKTGDPKVLGRIFSTEKCTDPERIKIIWITAKCERMAARFLVNLFKRDKATPQSLVKGCTRDELHNEVTRLLNAGVSDSESADKDSTRDTSPTKFSTRDTSPTNSTRDTSPTKFSTRDTSPTKFSTRDTSPTKFSTRDTSPANSTRDTSPTKFSPSDTSPTKFSTRDTSPTKFSPSDTSPTNSPKKAIHTDSPKKTIRTSSPKKTIRTSSPKKAICASSPKSKSGEGRNNKLKHLEFRQQVNIMRDILLQSNGIDDEDGMSHRLMLDRNAKGNMLTRVLEKETGLTVSELNRYTVHKFVASLSKRCYMKAQKVMDRWEAGDVDGQPGKTTVKQTLFLGMSGLTEETCYRLLTNLGEGNVTWTQHKRIVKQLKDKDKVPNRKNWEEHKSNREALERRIQTLKNQLSTATYAVPEQAGKSDNRNLEELQQEVASLQEEKKQFQEETKQLQEEKKQLQEEKKQLQEEKKQLQEENKKLEEKVNFLQSKLQTTAKTNLKRPSGEENGSASKRRKALSNWEGKEIRPGQLVAVAYNAPRCFHVGTVLSESTDGKKGEGEEEEEVEEEKVLVQFYKAQRKVLVNWGEPERVTPKFVLDTDVSVDNNGLTLFPLSKSEDKRLKTKLKDFFNGKSQ